MELSIGELAQRAGVTRRTIRYYVEIGLLQPPDGSGQGSGLRSGIISSGWR